MTLPNFFVIGAGKSGTTSLWRYLELLPAREPLTGFNSGYTPLVRATRLARELGVAELYLKDDSVSCSTSSGRNETQVSLWRTAR